MKPNLWKSGIYFVINLAIILATSFVLTSCTFSKDNKKGTNNETKLPPNEIEIGELKKITNWDEMLKEANPSKKWWLQFQWAQIFLKDTNQIQNACLILESLAQDKNFPLSTYSTILLKKNCPNKPSTSLNLSLKLTDKQKIVYRKSLKEFELGQAVIENNQNDRFVLLLELNAEEKNRNLKKNTYLKLLEEARRLKNSKLENLVRFELRKEFPQFMDDTLNNYYEISLDLVRDRSFKEAIERLNKVIANKSIKSDLKFKAFKTIYRIHKSTQIKKDQWALIERWGKWIKTQKKNSDFDLWNNEWTILKARWLWTEDQTNIAVATLENYSVVKSKDYLKEEVSYTLARIYDEKKDYDNAKNLYERSHQQSLLKNSETIKSKNTIYEKNLWSLAWLEYKNGNYEAARKSLEEIVSKMDGESDTKYLYWLAQAHFKLGHDELYKDVLLKLRKKEPLSFYSLLSYKDLKEPIPLLIKSSLSNKREFLLENLKNTLSESENLEIIWLISLEQSDVLQGWAKLLEKEDPNNYLPILLLYSQSGQFQNLLNSIQVLTSEQKSALIQNFPELLFPKPYFEDVQKNSQLRNVSMSFIYSIMRQESAFNVHARSSVDAMGLLQLMPNLAKQLSINEPINFRDEFDLFDPTINIFLGTKELMNLLKTHSNKYVPSIAGYNASSSVYRGWLKVRDRPDPIEFIEEIPYEETRTYIKLILRNMIFYERIYFKTNSFEFPSKWLEK